MLKMATKHPTLLTSVYEVVEAFGGGDLKKGRKELGRWADVGSSCISNWLTDGFIPPGWHFRMAEHLGKKGYVLSPKVFGGSDCPDPPPKSCKRRRPKANGHHHCGKSRRASRRSPERVSLH